MASVPKNIRILSLIILTVQTSAMVLLLRYSRTAHSQHYIISTAVLLSETLKCIILLNLLFMEVGYRVSALLRKLKEEIVLNYCETIKLALPAGLYVIQNNLLFVALTNLDAATYEVTYQLKILTTAMFSWILLGKKLKILHWFSLALLMAGVSLVQIDVNVVPAPVVDPQPQVGNEQIIKESIDGAHPNTEVSWLLGVLAVLVSCVSSGFSGVYFERLIKRGSNSSLLIRNIQLGIFSIIFATIGVYGDRVDVSRNGFFYAYSVSTWLVIIMQAVGGLVVSVTMKYADNILKGFATSISIVISSLISWILLGDKAPTMQFTLGAAIVIGATFLYGSATSDATKKDVDQSASQSKARENEPLTSFENGTTVLCGIAFSAIAYYYFIACM